MRRLLISPYGLTNLACEVYMQAYHKVCGLKTISLRYSNVYGPRQKDFTYSGVIAIWLGNIIRDEDLTIFGDGKNSRDFTYIMDIIQANLLVANQDVAGKIFKIGAGSPITLSNLGKLILKLTHKELLKINYTVSISRDNT